MLVCPAVRPGCRGWRQLLRLVVRRLAGQAPSGKAASAGVMVMTQPGLSFWSCRIR